MDIPSFMIDHSGTAVICAAGPADALRIWGKRIEDVQIV